MEDNEDEPEDVRNATPVADEIQSGTKDDKAKDPKTVGKKKDGKKTSRCDKNATVKKPTPAKSEADCCRGKTTKPAKNAPKSMSVMVYSPSCTFPKLKIIPREPLSEQEYVELLSTPSRKCPLPCLGKTVIRRIRAISERINELAQPAKRLVVGTLQERGGGLPPEMISNLVKSIEGSTCMTPEQAEKYFRDKESRKLDDKLVKKGASSKSQKDKKKSKIKCPSSLDKEAVISQYMMAEKFVKSILQWKCPIPVEEFQDIASVILRRLSFVLEYKPVDGGRDLKSQQMRFLADIVACWISGVLFEVAEEHGKEIEEELVEIAKNDEEEEDDKEEDDREEDDKKTEENESIEIVREDSEDDEEKVEKTEESGSQDTDTLEPVTNEAELQELAAQESADKLKAQMEQFAEEKARFEEEMRKRLEEEELEKAQREEEEKKRKENEENEAKLKAEMEEEEKRKREEAEEDERRKQIEAEEEEKKKREAEEDEKKKKEAEEDEARKKRWEEEDQKRKEQQEKEDQERMEKIQKELEEAEEKKKRAQEEEEEARKKREAELKEKQKMEGEEEKLKEVGPKDAIEKIGDGKLFKTDLPFMTFGKILDTMYEMIEDEPEGDETDLVHNRLQRALYEKFADLIKMEAPESLTENLKDVVDVLSGKVANWIKRLLNDSELKFIDKHPPEVESKEIRDWGKWIDQVTDRAGDWAKWIHRVVDEAESQSDNGSPVKRGDWQNWTSDMDTKALLWRRYYLETIHQAHHNRMMIADRPVVKTGEKHAYSANEEEINNTDLAE